MPRPFMRTWATAASTAMRDRIVYAGNFVASMMTYALFIFIFSRVWAGAYAHESTIAGYDRVTSVWYFIIAEVPSFGLGRYFWNLSRDMKSGQVAYLLARPYDFVGYHYAERFGGSLVDGLLIVVEGLVIGLVLVGPLPAVGGLVPELARGAFVVLSLLAAGTLNFFLQLALSLTAFWLEENDALYWIYQKLALVVGTLIPIEFLPDAARRIAVWTPFPYVSYAPARIAVAFSYGEALSLLGRQLVWIGIAIALARGVFVLGSRRLAVNGG